jgi:hypothetical protein
MFTLCAFESTVSNAQPAPITPVPDGTVAIISNDLRVPTELPNLFACAAMINTAVAPIRVQITSPSLRSLLPFDVSPFANGLVFGSDFDVLPMWDTPLPLVGLEPLNTYVQNSSSVVNRSLVWLSDGAAKPTTGKVYTVRATGAAATVTATWVNTGGLVFSTTLPTGTYQVVGFRAISANMVASRIFFPGYAWRPGVIGEQSEASITSRYFRYGYIGVFGQFLNTVPPTIEVLGVTDTAQTFYLDLIKTA